MSHRAPSFVTGVLSLLLTAIALPAAAQSVVGPDRVFIRFTNTRPDDMALVIRLNVVPNHDQPFTWSGKIVYVDAQGEHEAAAAATRWLQPGETSPWIDIGRYMNRQGTRSPETYLSPVLCGILTVPRADGLFLTAEVAINDGGEKRITRTVAVERPELVNDGERDFPWKLGYATWNSGRPLLPTLALLIPSQPQHGEKVWTAQEKFDWQLDFISQFPDVGRLPERFVFTTHGRPEILHALGYRGYPEDVIEVNLGDEINIELETPPHELDRRFRAEMRTRGFDPLELMSDNDAADVRALPEDEQWERVTLLPPLPESPKQFYEQAVFRYRMWGEELAARWKPVAERNPDKKVLAGANFSPHMNVWPDARQWVNLFRDRAMNMAWSEDWWWQLPEISPQVYGWLLSAFRLAHSFDGAPIQFYIMPFRGNSQENIRRLNALALANGTTIFNHFHTQGQTLITWDYVDYMDSPHTYRTIHDIIRDWGAVESRLYGAMPRQANVAILVSDASDTWDTEDLGGAGHLYSAQYNVNNDERKNIYLALRHAHIPVDMLADADILDGRLEGYKLLYIVGSEMRREAVAPLRAWVEAGGTVYGAAGGGMLDQYRRPIEEMRALYGLRNHALDRVTRFARPRSDLPDAEPLDTLLWPVGDGAEVEVPVLFYRDTLEVADQPAVSVVGSYQAANRPAAVHHRVGRGGAMYVGALLGTAYVRPAATASSQMLPVDFPQPIRQLIVANERLPRISPAVAASDPLVQISDMQHESGRSLVLIRWRDGEATDVTLTFSADEPVQRVRSLRAAGAQQGRLDDQPAGDLPLTRHADGTMTVTLPLQTYDVLYVD